MKIFWTLLAIALAATLQTGLSLVLHGAPRSFDPFLLVVLYCGLTYGETHGMLAGAVAGWVQDVLFGGQVAGLSGLTKLMVGFVVGLAGTRFLLVGPGPQLLVLFAATTVDALVIQSLASVFGIPTQELSAPALALRSVVNAVTGVILFAALDRHIGRERRF